MSVKRKYPVGIQSFESLREEGYIYVDKTELIYKMVTEGKTYFLSRPRRFGKSLLVDTLHCLFDGRRHLFDEMETEDGIVQPQLFIARSNWKWVKHPILRFDFSRRDYEGLTQLDELVDKMLSTWELTYGIDVEDNDAGSRLERLIQTAHEQTGKKVVVLVDEYDNFVLNHLDDPELAAKGRQRFSNLFSPLKAMDEHLKFVFITGISKFSQMGIFSKLNQLQNISLTSRYEAICGISEEELVTQMRIDIEQMADRNGKTFDDQFADLKAMYDGYHFSSRLTDIYNPFSVVNALNFDEDKLQTYWFASGTPGALIKMLSQMPPIDVSDVDGVNRPSSVFDQPLESFADALPVLFQSGYVTIKDYDGDYDEYKLGFPNQEVRTGFAECLFRYITENKSDTTGNNVFRRAFFTFRRTDDFPTFMEAAKTFFAAFPFKLDDTRRNERHYHSLLLTLLMAFGADVQAEEPTAKGCSDLVLRMPNHIYVIELKNDQPAAEALRQINDRGYADKYALDPRPVTKVGITFSTADRNITEWEVED